MTHIFIFLLSLIAILKNIAAQDPQKSKLGVTFGSTAKYEGSAQAYGRLYLFSRTRTSFCGGTLIYRDLIVTAAHCLYGMEQAMFCVGSTSCTPASADDTCVFISIEDYGYIHKGYLEAKPNDQIFDDIAFIELPVPIVNENVKPVPLCRLETCAGGLESYHRQVGRLCGCGATEDLTKSTVLLETTLATIDIDDGIEAFDRLIRPFQNRYKIFCAVSAVSNANSNACLGDSGGPFFIKNPATGVEELCGVVSFGGKVCNKKFPSCYTAVTQYLDFIFGKVNAVNVGSLKNCKKFPEQTPELMGDNEIKNLNLINNLHNLTETLEFHSKREK